MAGRAKQVGRQPAAFPQRAWKLSGAPLPTKPNQISSRPAGTPVPLIMEPSFLQPSQSPQQAGKAWGTLSGLAEAEG